MMGSYERHLVLPLLVACCALLSGRAGAAGHPVTPAPDSIGVLRPPLPVALDPFFAETGNAPTPPFASITAGGFGLSGHSATPAPDSIGVLHPPLPAASDPFFADLEERALRFFWETGNAPMPPLASIAAGGFGLSGHWATPTPEASGALLEAHGVALDPFFADLEERTFRFFWETGNPKNGLIADRYPTPSFASIAAVGFGLTSYPIGVERGYILREA